MAVYVDQRPNKYLQLSQVIGDYIDSSKRNQFRDDTLSLKKQELMQQIIEAYTKADPDTRARMQRAFPGALPDLPPSQGEQDTAALAHSQSTAKQKDIQGMAQPSILPGDSNGNFSPSAALMGDPSGRGNVVQPFDRVMALQNRNRGVYNADLPKDIIDKGETFYTQGTPGETQANRIANKQIPTGQESWTDTNITAPKAKADIAKTGAETSKLGAETVGVREKTRGEKITNDAFSGATAPGGSPSPSGEPTDISGAPPLVRQLIERKYDPMLMRRWKPEQQMAIAAMVQKYDPSFSMADYPAQVATKKAFTSGQYSQNILSANQLIGHIKTLDDAFNKIDNTRFPTWNAVANTAGAQGGSTKTQAALGSFNTAADAVATEAARLYKGVGSTAEREIAEWRKNVSPNMSPAAFKASVQTMFHLLGTRLQNLDDTYRQGTGRPRDFTFLRGRSSQILKAMGIDPSEMEGGMAQTPEGNTGNPDPLGILK